MRKILIGAIVGGIIIFVLQSLSWMVLNLHQSANRYTPKQTEIMNFLNSQFTEDGQFYLPNQPETLSMEEAMKSMKENIGKPWAIISYHKEMKSNMVMNMIRGLLVNMIAVALLCWILLKLNPPTFQTIFLSSLFTGIIIFLNIPYTQHIWYETFDLYAHLIDALICWGVVGLWLGYYFRGKGLRTVK